MLTKRFHKRHKKRTTMNSTKSPFGLLLWERFIQCFLENFVLIRFNEDILSNLDHFPPPVLLFSNLYDIENI